MITARCFNPVSYTHLQRPIEIPADTLSYGQVRAEFDGVVDEGAGRIGTVVAACRSDKGHRLGAAADVSFEKVHKARKIQGRTGRIVIDDIELRVIQTAAKRDGVASFHP